MSQRREGVWKNRQKVTKGEVGVEKKPLLEDVLHQQPLTKKLKKLLKIFQILMVDF